MEVSRYSLRLSQFARVKILFKIKMPYDMFHHSSALIAPLHVKYSKVNGYTSMFSTILQRGTNFMISYLLPWILPNYGLFLNKRLDSKGVNSFF